MTKTLSLRVALRILKNEDYEIDTAYSGEEGLSKIANKKYDLVITDLMMPGMSGMDVLRTIKEKKLDLTVVIFTVMPRQRQQGKLSNGAF
jgi:DNA-binding response OmpR family regulator